MEKQISIIIPTYNMEEYIGKCLDSLLIPEIDQVEVLVVNDGSKDRSSEIAHQYAQQYPNSIIVIDKSNGNYGSCINAALPICSGRYVKILDADDTFDKSAFSEYVKSLSNRNEDVLVNDYVKVYEDGNEFPQNSFFSLGYNDEESYTFENAMLYLCSDLHMHCIAYKLENILKMNYRQTEGVSYTDNEWIFAPMGSANTFAFIKCGYLYKYLLGRDGQTVDPSMSLSRIRDHFEVIKAQALFYENTAVKGLKKEFLEKQLITHIKLVYLMVIDSNNKKYLCQLSDFDKEFHLTFPKIYELSNNIIYTPRIQYKFIKCFRQNKNPTRFKFNPFVKLLDFVFNHAARAKSSIKSVVSKSNLK